MPSRRPTPREPRRLLCVVLHDVAPARWAACQRVMAALDEVAREAGVALPRSLLVVPAWHGDTQLPRDYLLWLWRQCALGHELVLHGLTHLDEAPVRDLPSWLSRRLWHSAGEAEFAAIDAALARHKLRQARRWALQHGLPMSGFVAPAWRLSRGARRAVQAAGFEHLCTAAAVELPALRTALPVRSVAFSHRSAARRWVSALWARGPGAPRRSDRVLRLDLHPDDADHPLLRRTWQALLVRALREREPVRLDALAQRATDIAA